MAHKKTDDAQYSKFWLGDNASDEKTMSGLDLIKLSSYRRAIANFVMILTGRNIPVGFAERRKSFTNGEMIQIGGELTKGQFDSTVGLALHEASHIVKSDFGLLVNLWEKVPNYVYEKAKNKMTKSDIAAFTKLMLNYVEDRYIDRWATKNAPGYRGYYVALYSRFFNSALTSKALASNAYRKATLKNYKFRIINLTNPSTDLDALPGLREIYELLDLKTILRLDTPADRFDLACEIAAIVLAAIVKEDAGEKGQASKQDDSDDESESDSGGDAGEDSEDGDEDSDESDEGGEDGDEDSDDESKDSNGSDDSDDVDDLLGGENGESEKLDKIRKQEELNGTDEPGSDDFDKDDIKKLEKEFSEQTDFTNGELQPKGMDSDTVARLKTLEDGNVGIIPTGGEYGIDSFDAILVRNLTQELMNDNHFPYTSPLSFSKTKNQEAVMEGVSLGIMLGRKLQVRNDDKVTRMTRLNHGKIEKRLIADLGYGSEKVFYRNFVDQYKKAHLHISVDASSSMGANWSKTMTMLVALAKAYSMVKNLDITISFRSAIDSNGVETPYILLAYDSRKDKFSKITQLFPAILPAGTTPEGLAFQTIIDVIPPASPDMDSYFINLSDGEPYFNGGKYSGLPAYEHTAKQMSKLRNMGVQVISYFLENNVVDEDAAPDLKLAIKTKATLNRMAFTKMYGKDAQFIDSTNITEIAHTLNKKFLET